MGAAQWGEMRDKKTKFPVNFFDPLFKKRFLAKKNVRPFLCVNHSLKRCYGISPDSILVKKSFCQFFVSSVGHFIDQLYHQIVTSSKGCFY
jgi:hypothetical protein